MKIVRGTKYLSGLLNNFCHPKMAQQPKYIHVNGKAMYFTINYQDRPRPTLNQVKDMLNKFTNNKPIQYVVMGSEQDDKNKHVHVFVYFENAVNIHKTPIMTNLDNVDYFIHFTPITKTEQYNGGYKRIVDYIKKHQQNGGTVEEEGDFEDLPSTKLNQGVINEQLANPDFKEACETLKAININWWFNNKKHFRTEWIERHPNNTRRKTQIKLSAWDETNPVVKGLRTYIKLATENTKERIPCLVIVSPTRLGKTELVTDALKNYEVDEFRGRLMFDGRDDLHDFDFRVFDDTNLNDIAWDDMKALISTRNTSIIVNVKYDTKTIKSIPTIILLNPGRYNEFHRNIIAKGDGQWWQKNSIVLSTTKQLWKSGKNRKFAKKSKLESELDVLKSLGANISDDLYERAKEMEIESTMGVIEDDIEIAEPDLIQEPVPEPKSPKSPSSLVEEGIAHVATP